MADTHIHTHTHTHMLFVASWAHYAKLLISRYTVALPVSDGALWECV